MDFFDLDAALPVYVDFLASFERGVDGIVSSSDAMKELVLRGVQERRFVPAAEMAFTKDQIVVRTSPNREIFDTFDIRNISDPVAFIRKGSQTDGFSRVVIFTEIKAGHFNNNGLFHAVQCIDGDPTELVELLNKLIAGQGNSRDEPVVLRQHSNGNYNNNNYSRQMSHVSQASLDYNWFTNQNPPSNFKKLTTGGGSSGTDSLRSATISRRSYGVTRASAVFGFDGVNGAVPVTAPTPPGQRDRNATPPARPLRSDNPLPLVIDPIRTAETLGFERPAFIYSTSENQKQKDGILLNYCIDDIERFQAILEKAKAPGSTRSVTASEFFSIFQKFKLTFNLLARLDGHISDPSAETILHHLFPPLAKLVDECYDLFDEFVVREVATPLPTVKAINMLQNYLTPSELTVWRALGDYWLNPRSEWEGDIAPYSPRFYDGWSPGTIQFFDDDQPNYDEERGDDVKSYRGSIGSFNPNLDYDNFRDELIEREATIALVVYSRSGSNDKELSVNKGEYLEILESSKNWWRAINYTGQTGFVPCTILKKMKFEDARPDLEEPKKKPRERKISPQKEKRRSQVHSSAESESSEAVEDTRKTSKSNHYVPPPPPPPPPQQVKPRNDRPVTPRKREMNNQDTIRSALSVHEELKSVLDIINKREKHLEIMKTPEVYVAPTSNPKEVQKWLKEKQFSKRVHDELFGFDGKKLFSMTRRDLIDAFGRKEGTRLDSQITISRSMANYTTGKSSELRKVLEKHRERVERGKSSGEEDEDDDEEEVGRPAAGRRDVSRQTSRV